MTLGATSDTDDPTGSITAVADAQAPSTDRVREVLSGMVGAIEQVPPAHSAVHVEGRRAYKLARAGKTPDLAPRTVTVHALEAVSFAYPALELSVVCGGGTYVRALARDIGQALGCGGYCSALVRTAVGPFTLEQAVAPEQVDPALHLLSPILALGPMPRVVLNPSACSHLARGQAARLAPAQVPRGAADGKALTEIAVLDEADRLVAIGALGEDGVTLRPGKVFSAG